MKVIDRTKEVTQHFMEKHFLENFRQEKEKNVHLLSPTKPLRSWKTMFARFEISADKTLDTMDTTPFLQGINNHVLRN